MRQKPSNNTSGYIGVDKVGQLYRVRVPSTEGRQVLGKFKTAEEADAVRMNELEIRKHLAKIK